MRSGATAAAHQEQAKSADDVAREAKVKKELAQLDTDLFEKILRDAAGAKTDLLRDIPSSDGDPALISIMGLIDDNKERLAAEKEHNNTSSKAPVKFDEVVDFIDDGADEEMEVDKLPEPVTFVKRISVKAPIRGNPVVDMEAMNGELQKDSNNEELKYSNLEKGMPRNFYQKNLVNAALETMTKEQDDCDMEFVRAAQVNDTCDENEQIAYLTSKDIPIGKTKNVLGPMSGGQFISFFSPKEVIGTDLGAANPISSPNAHFFQTLTPNGRLLPAVPRKYFGPDFQAPPSGAARCRPAPLKAPVTIMLQSTGSPSIGASNDAYIQLNNSASSNGSSSPKSSPPTPPLAPPPNLQLAEQQFVSASTKKRNKKKERAARKALEEQEKKELEPEEHKNELDNENKEVEQLEQPVEHKVEQKEQKEPEPEVELTEEEKEARRLKNRKDRMKKKAKKQEEKKSDMKAIDTVANQMGKEQEALRKENASPMGGSTSSQPEESPKSRAIRGNNGRKKTEKSVVDEYIVPDHEPNASGISPLNGNDLVWLVKLYLKDKEAAVIYARKKGVIKPEDGADQLAAALKELGIDHLDELERRPKKVKPARKGGKSHQQNSPSSSSQRKETIVDEEELEEDLEDLEEEEDDEQLEVEDVKKVEVEKDHKDQKMDESTVAASIAKKSSDEDDNQSYVSAQENVEANTRTSTPEEFQDARQSRDDTDNVMLDPKNYVDDNRIEAVAQQLADEDAEFVTVSSKKGKKNKKVEQQPAAVAVNYAAAAAASGNRRASSTTSSSNNQNHQNHQNHGNQRNNNRPMPHSSTLGDFMETTPKKDSHKNAKKKASGGSGGSQKKPMQKIQHDEMPPPPSPAFEDALDQPISVNTSLPAPPSGGVSYADAAKHKKSAASSSGDSSPTAYDTPPQSTNSPAPGLKKEIQNAPKSPIPETSVAPTTSSAPTFASAVTGGVQLPATALAETDISFGYEETPEEKRRAQRRNKKNSGNSGAQGASRHATQPQRINAGDLLRRLGNQKVAAMPTESTSEDTIAMKQSMAKIWDIYQNSGSKPIRYQVGQPF